ASAQSIKSGSVHFVVVFTCRVSLVITKISILISAAGEVFDLPLNQSISANQGGSAQFDVDFSDKAPSSSSDAGHTYAILPASTSTTAVFPVLVSRGDTVRFGGDSRTINIESSPGNPGSNCPTSCPSGGGICAPSGCACPSGTKFDGGICDGNPNGCGAFCSAGTRICNC